MSYGIAHLAKFIWISLFVFCQFGYYSYQRSHLRFQSLQSALGRFTPPHRGFTLRTFTLRAFISVVAFFPAIIAGYFAAVALHTFGCVHDHRFWAGARATRITGVLFRPRGKSFQLWPVRDMEILGMTKGQCCGLCYLLCVSKCTAACVVYLQRKVRLQPRFKHVHRNCVAY